MFDFILLYGKNNQPLDPEVCGRFRNGIVLDCLFPYMEQRNRDLQTQNANLEKKLGDLSVRAAELKKRKGYWKRKYKGTPSARLQKMWKNTKARLVG
jgi:hypothetical protein